MILYHGSNMIIDKIDLEKSKPNKDLAKVSIYQRMNHRLWRWQISSLHYWAENLL